MIKTEAITNLRKKLEDGEGFFSRFKRMGASVLALVENRLDLLSVDLEAEKLRLTAMVLTGAAALFFLGFGILLATITLIVVFWDSAYRELVLGILSGVFIVLGIGFMISAKKQRDMPSSAFKATIHELRKDQQALNDDQ